MHAYKSCIQKCPAALISLNNIKIYGKDLGDTSKKKVSAFICLM